MVKCDVVVGAIFSVSGISTSGPKSQILVNTGRLFRLSETTGADASLDAIAKQAGVGPGTLYRHFPTREELLKAVYRKELETLAAAQKFAATLPPVEPLRAWLLLFVDAVAAKQIIAPALNSLLGDYRKEFEDSHALVQQALRNLVKRGIKSGDISDAVLCG